MVVEAPAVKQTGDAQAVKPVAKADAVDNLRLEVTAPPSNAQARGEALAIRRAATTSLDDDFAIIDMSAPGKAERPNEAIEQKAKALKEALDQKKFGVEIMGIGVPNPDVDKILKILDPLSPAERKTVEKRFQELYDPTCAFDPANPASSKLRIELANKLGADSSSFHRIEAILDRRAGAVNDAGQAMEALSKMATDRIAGEAQLRAVVSTLNARDSERLQKEFEQKYGKTLDQSMKDASVSPETVAFVESFRKGAENRSADDLVRLANLAIDGSIKTREDYLKSAGLTGISPDIGGVDIKQYKELFKDVLAGNSPATEQARKKLQEDPNFEKRFASAFNDFAGRPDQALRDYINSGGPSLSTIVEQNMGKTLGFMLNNPESVSLATQNISEAERSNYKLGRSLVGRQNDSTLTAGERAALDYFTRTHESLTRGAGSKTWLADSWEANILYGKDNIISKMAATHADGWIRSSHTADAILSAAEGLSEKDWVRLNDEFKANPENGGQFRADIAASLDNYAPEEKERLLALIDTKAKAGTYLLSQDIRRGFVDGVADKTTTNWLGVETRDAAAVVDGILNLSAAEIARFQKDETFRKQVDKTVADSLSGSDQLLARRLLDKVQNLPAGEKVKPDAIDQVLIDKAEDAKPDQILRNIQAAYQQKDASGQTLHERLKSGQPLSAADQLLAKTIESQVDKAISTGLGVPQNIGNSPELRKPVVAEFLETGKLSLNLKSAIGYPLVDVLAEVRTASQQDLYDLRERLKPEQQKILDAAIAQKDDQAGAMRLEDKLRSFVLGDGSKPEQFKEQLAKLTEDEKAELKRAYAAKYGSQDKPADLDKDFLSKVDKTKQSEFTSLLSTGARESRQSFYDNLRRYLDRSGITVDGTEINTERALRQQQDALEQYQRVYQTLPKEKQELLDQYFNESMKQYKDSKDKLSELAINAAITATALAAAPFSAGMSLQTIALLSAGGGAFRLAARDAMMGSDFDDSASNVSKELINGAAAMALNFLGGKEIDAVMASAQKSGAVFGAYLARHGVNEATSRAAAAAAGFSMDVLAGGTIGAATNLGTEVLLAPVSGNNVDWNSLWNSAAMGFALGAVIPVGIKGLQAAGRGADTVMNVVRGEKSFLWKPELNQGYVLTDGAGNVVPVMKGESVALTDNHRQVETRVVDGRLVDKSTGQPLRTKDGSYLDELGRPLPASGEKPLELFDPPHRSHNELTPEARAQAAEARALYSRLASENPNLSLVDFSKAFDDWRAENPELMRRATAEAKLRDDLDKALARGDKSEIERLRKEHADAVSSSDAILKTRAPQLQDLVNQRLATEGLPPVVIDLVGALDGKAAFSFDADGNPRIAISRETLLSNEATVQEVINHEVDHYLQVSLQARQVRELAQVNGVMLNPNNPADVERFRQEYARQMANSDGVRGGLPSDDYIKEILARGPLTEQQRALSDRLLAATRSGAPARADSIETANLFREIGNKTKPLAEQIKANEQSGLFNHDVIDQVLDPKNKLLTRREWDQNPNLTDAKVNEIRAVLASDSASLVEKNAKARELLELLQTRQKDLNAWRLRAHERYAGEGQIDELFADVAGANAEEEIRAAGYDQRFAPKVEDESVFAVGSREHVDGWSRQGESPNAPVRVGDSVLWDNRPTKVIGIAANGKLILENGATRPPLTFDQIKRLTGSEPRVGMPVPVMRSGENQYETGWYVSRIDPVTRTAVVVTDHVNVRPEQVRRIETPEVAVPVAVPREAPLAAPAQRVVFEGGERTVVGRMPDGALILKGDSFTGSAANWARNGFQRTSDLGEYSRTHAVYKISEGKYVEVTPATNGSGDQLTVTEIKIARPNEVQRPHSVQAGDPAIALAPDAVALGRIEALRAEQAILETAPLEIEAWLSGGNRAAGQRTAIITRPDGSKQRVVVHEIPDDISSDVKGAAQRLTNEIAGQEISVNLFGTLPSTAVREAIVDGRKVKVRIQEFAGDQFEQMIRIMSREAGFGTDSESVVRFLESNPQLRQKLEEALIERQILGDTDDHGYNFLINGSGEDLKISNIDFDFAFSKRDIPYFFVDNTKGVNRKIFDHLSEKPLSQATVERIRGFLEKCDTPAGKARLKELGLSDQKVEATLARARWFADRKTYPKALSFQEALRLLPDEIE